MSSGREQTFGQSEMLLSITDLDSRIKYANPEFCKIAGYELDDLVGKPHNIVRHQDMPKAAFNDLWTYIQQGKSWMGPVKNRCKNGDYYWVNAYVSPITDSNGKNTEFQSVRTKLAPHVQKRADKLYARLNKGETPKSVRFTTDMSMWFQVFSVIVALLALVVTVFSGAELYFTLPLLFASSLGSAIYIHWRRLYVRVIKDARGVFNNPLMSYIYSGNNDAVGTVQLAIAMQKAEVNAVVGRVTDVSISVNKDAAAVTDSSSQVSATLNEQRNEIEQVATAINEMSATVQSLTQTVTDIAQAATQGKDTASQGENIVKTTVDAITELSVQLGEVDTVIARLVDGSKSIASVLSEISSIADQTNLLALNAAIEAARAGEHGRGFAVVAEEVRALALRTQQSTQEVNNLLSTLQNDSNSAVTAMSKGNELSENCVDLSKQTGTSLQQIIEAVMQISNSVTQVATAMEQQSVSASQVDDNVKRINDFALVSESSSADATELSSHLLDRIADQQTLVEQFKR